MGEFPSPIPLNSRADGTAVKSNGNGAVQPRHGTRAHHRRCLLECTEVILEKELNILSKLHRVRLLKLIDRSHSAKVLRGKGPYGTLTQ